MTEREKNILTDFVRLYNEWRGKFGQMGADADFAGLARDVGETCNKYPDDYLAEAMALMVLEVFDYYYKHGGFPVDVEAPFFAEAVK